MPASLLGCESTLNSPPRQPKSNSAPTRSGRAPTRVTLPADPPSFRKGDARRLSRVRLARESVDLVVTSPPYWRRRDYEHESQLGQERLPDDYAVSLVDTLNGWVPYLRPHASVFLNIGDTYVNGSLACIPSRVELLALKSGWKLVNRIAWVKAIGVPQPSRRRLASRHEIVLHLARCTNFYFDLFGLNEELGNTANPGDVWQPHPTRNKSEHIAPFPPDLARYATLLACPPHVCTKCGRPYERVLGPSQPDPTRKQAERALELFEQHGLTSAHRAAIRAVGISDAGKGKRIQNGAGRNSVQVMKLAAEAKAALGGYFREFTFGPRKHLRWSMCKCRVVAQSGTVLDPFAGTGTTLYAAHKLGRNAIGVDLTPPRKGWPISM